MEHEAAVSLDRSTKEYGQIGEAFGLEGNIDFLQQGPETHVDRPIDDHAQRATRVMFRDIDQALGKIRVNHRRHGDEKMVSQVDALHGLILMGGGG
jgi:hypothetical protein